jgi:hypothetical protein
MEEKPTQYSTRAMFIAITVAGIAISIWLCRSRPEPSYRSPTRWEDFYVGMPFREAKQYLPDGTELEQLALAYKDGPPKRGQPLYIVIVKKGDEVLGLVFDPAEHLVEIRLSRR